MLSLVLSLTEGNITTTEVEEIDYDKISRTCGINYCPAGASESSNATEVKEESSDDNFSATKSQLYILAGVYLACSLLASVTVALFVTPLTQ